MPERRTPEEILAEVEAWARDQPVIGDDVMHGKTVEMVADAFRGLLDRAMVQMGFAESERAGVAATVRAATSEDGRSVDVTYEAPARVKAYMDAVHADDFDRATLVLRAREG